MKARQINEIHINGDVFKVTGPIKTHNFSGVLPNSNTYIKEVIYSNPATIVFWNDGTKTVCKCKSPDIYSEEIGLVLCMLKKLYGAANLKKLFEDWIPLQTSLIKQKVTLKDVIKKNKR